MKFLIFIMAILLTIVTFNSFYAWNLSATHQPLRGIASQASSCKYQDSATHLKFSAQDVESLRLLCFDKLQAYYGDTSMSRGIDIIDRCANIECM